MPMIRKVTRFLLASLLWLHALLLFEFARPSLAPIASRLHLNVGEAMVLCLLATFSILAAYGLGNILIDLIYIYFFPFVLMYYAGRGAYTLIRSLNRIFARLGTERVEKFDINSIPGWSSRAVVPPATNKIEPVKTEQVPPDPTVTAKPVLRRALEFLVRPFARFSLLWCLLLLLTTHPLLQWIALVVVLLHIGRALAAIVGVAILSTNWLSQLEDRIKSSAENWINKVLNANEASPSQDLTQTVSILASFQLGL